MTTTPNSPAAADGASEGQAAGRRRAVLCDWIEDAREALEARRLTAGR